MWRFVNTDELGELTTVVNQLLFGTFDDPDTRRTVPVLRGVSGIHLSPRTFGGDDIVVDAVGAPRRGRAPAIWH